MTSKFILGTVQLGLKYGINNAREKPSYPEAASILKYAAESGIHILDTADAYGDGNEVIGKYHSDNPRFEIINKFYLDEARVIEKVQKSLAVLKTSSFYAYLFHSYKEMDQVTFYELLELKKEGKINRIGVSVYSNDEFDAAVDNEHIDVIQFPFNLLDNMALRKAQIKKAKLYNKELHIRSVFLQGLFFMKKGTIPEKLQPLVPYLDTINKIAKKNQLAIRDMALMYALSIPEIDKVIIGVDTVDQLKQNLGIADKVLPVAIVDEINDISVKEQALLSPANW